MRTAIFLAAAAVLCAMSCEKDPLQPSLPATQQPNPIPAQALVKQLKWSENDHVTFTYDNQNQVTQLRSQWQFVQGDPTQIRTIVHDFQYDAKKRLVQANYTGGFSAKYFYKGKLIDKVQEFFPGGAIMNEYAYEYRNERIAHIYREAANEPGQAPTLYRYDLEYDARGNMTRIATYRKQPGAPPAVYELVESTEYSDFDDELNPLSWIEPYPYLPKVRWQFNNPRKEVVRYYGSPGTTNVYIYSYNYNASGIPASRTKTGANNSTTVHYYY